MMNANETALIGLENTIQCGDAAFLLKQIPSDSIDFVVTSPPYYLQRQYNSTGMCIGAERTVDDYIAALIDVFDEVVRIVKPTGNIVYNVGDKYLDKSLQLVPFRFAIQASEKNNVRIVNNITWVKSNPTPRQFARRLVSSTEPFFHFSKTDNYFYDRDKFMDNGNKVKRHEPSDRLGMRYRTLIDESSLPPKNNRKAMNALNEVIKDVQEGRIASFRMKIRGIHAEAFGGQDGGRKCQMDKNGFTIIRIYGKTMKKKDVIENPVESIPNIKHCAIYPVAIIRELIKMLCPPSGIVLDPYVGSGTTAVAAVLEGRQYIGVDIDPEYCDIARSRVKQC